MDSTAALGLRMSALFPPATSVAEVVEWFGAMQAQDVSSGLWSFGARLPGFTLADVEAAVERREAVRTWPMRGTVHFVPPADVHWMLELMGSRALAGAAKRRESLGLSQAEADRAVDILGTALAGGGRLTRAQCLSALAEKGVETGGQRGYHLLWYASQRGVTVIGPHIGKEQSFVLLDEWVPSPRRPSREEALALIAQRYFQSHGPATRKDFAGWTGLTMTDCKTGIAAATLETVDVNGIEMLVAPGGADQPGADWLALPGFDEYMLGYKDRSLMATPEQIAAIIPGGNGVFQSTLVRRGRVVATWKRAITAKGVTVTVNPLVSFTAKDRRAADDALAVYASYLGLPLTVKNP
ncbi:winged helix DNA-binding domain-containing protein [Paractinoplanes atraurantiacus]|uniref:Winged helix DNA-binding domain-containing protein n=1 Tax=Paractinoplanes atraurantiacus TaxID=1036182 RepID=A0A285IM26_9ACTN|nr:winged helix DNA-binding domain-containing protein [Actinoplanes atraurantiacus]SNY49055.1 Winged helix DNA-binding domain-containing protein [Actinoplanes atraurantiacus]